MSDRIKRPSEEGQDQADFKSGKANNSLGKINHKMGSFDDSVRSEDFTDSTNRGGPLGGSDDFPEGGDSTRRAREREERSDSDEADEKKKSA